MADMKTDFRSNSTDNELERVKIENKKTQEKSDILKSSEYKMVYSNIDECIKRFDILIERIEYEKASVCKVNSSKGAGQVVNALTLIDKQYNSIWKNLLLLFKHTKQTVANFEETSKIVDNSL